MDSTTMSVIGLVVSVMLTLIGILFRRINEMDSRLREAPSREEVRRVISDKLEPTVVLHKELKEDIKELSNKLDRLLENRS